MGRKVEPFSKRQIEKYKKELREITNRSRLGGRKYTPEQREAQRQICLRDRPWEMSTGPKTFEGKLLVSLNGRRKPFSRRMRALLKKLLRQ